MVIIVHTSSLPSGKIIVPLQAVVGMVGIFNTTYNPVDSFQAAFENMHA